MHMVGLDCNEFFRPISNRIKRRPTAASRRSPAFATNPDIILMDEPFSALDPITRTDLQDELVQLQSKLKKQLYSSHTI